MHPYRCTPSTDQRIKHSSFLSNSGIPVLNSMTLRPIYQHITRLAAALPTALTLVLAGAFSVIVRADVINVHHIKEWQKNLVEASTPQDSIDILYNLFDISLRNDTGVYSKQLIQLCERVRDYDTELDIIRKVVNKNGRDDAVVDSLSQIVSRIPFSENQRETMIFIEIRKLLSDLNDMDEADRMKMLNNLILKYEDDPSQSLYDRILPLYRLTVVLGMTVGGDLYADCMERLAILIRQLPKKNGPLTSLYTTQAAMIYSILGEHEKSVEANREYLEIIRELVAENESRGRIYASYKNNIYLALRRMLTNYQALTDQEVDSIYSAMCQLTEDDPELAEEFNNMARAKSFYLVAKKRYPEAVTAIRTALDNEKNRNYRTRLLKMLIESSEAVGDRQTLAEARQQYIDLLEAGIEAGRSGKIRELQLLLNVNSSSQDRLDDAEDELKDSSDRYRLIIAIILASVFLILTAMVVGFRYLITRKRSVATRPQA